MTRRTAITTVTATATTTLATGFALATWPISAAWYGRLDSPKDDLHPDCPIGRVGELEAPVLGLYGGADSGIPNELVAKTQEKLKTAQKPSEIVLYPDTPHGFYADYRASYREPEANDGWKRLLAWFEKHGVK